MLDSLGKATHWEKLLGDQLEGGGFFVQKANGPIEFVGYPDATVTGIPPGPCLSGSGDAQVGELQTAGYTILGEVHTHPNPAVHQTDPGNCWTVQNGMLAHVPHQLDGTILLPVGIGNFDDAPWKSSSPPAFPGYLLDPNFVYRWGLDAKGKVKEWWERTNHCFGRN